MDTCLHTYKVTYYDAINKCEQVESGIVFAEDIYDAVLKITAYYGKDTIYSTQVDQYDTSEVLPLNDEIIKSITETIL